MNCRSKILNIIIYFFLVIITGCNRSDILFIHSIDRSQSITVIDQGNVRYIINGKHPKLPEENYVILDLEAVDPLGDAIHICWNGKYDWEVVVHGAILKESQLDSTKFKFSTRLPVDEHQVPTELKFREEGCAIFSFYSMRLSPERGTIVEYR